MNDKQKQIMGQANGFIAALDQSGGSTPKALKQYGINEDRYSNEDEMFTLVHQMRTRIIKSKSFDSSKIIGAILFEQTMDREIDGLKTGDFLWEKKGIVPFIKVDKGLAEEQNNVQLMKPMPELDDLLKRSVERHMFGTKMRSVIHEYNEEGIKAVIAQQFEIAKKIASYGLVPIVEPEVSIKSSTKEKCEDFMLECIKEEMKSWPKGKPVMFKVTIPSKAGLYSELMEMEDVLRVVALSGGYSREDANSLLKKNPGLIASFSRALAEGLYDSMSDEEFDSTMGKTVETIYDASTNKE